MLLSKLGSFSHISSSMDLPAKLQQGNGNNMPVLRRILWPVRFCDRITLTLPNLTSAGHLWGAEPKLHPRVDLSRTENSNRVT